MATTECWETGCTKNEKTFHWQNCNNSYLYVMVGIGFYFWLLVLSTLADLPLLLLYYSYELSHSIAHILRCIIIVLMTNYQEKSGRSTRFWNVGASWFILFVSPVGSLFKGCSLLQSCLYSRPISQRFSSLRTLAFFSRTVQLTFVSFILSLSFGHLICVHLSFLVYLPHLAILFSIPVYWVCGSLYFFWVH